MDPLNPNLSKFPKSIKAKIHEVTLEPGCILYLPSYWLHQVQGDVASLNVSVNIWLSRGVFKLVPGFFNILPAYLKRNILSRF
jgi:ribosomal protein L16 Arg81 hydroxylase